MKAVIYSVTSDLGLALVDRWLQAGHGVHGTFRRRCAALDELEARGLQTLYCDFGEATSVDEANRLLLADRGAWDALVVAPALLGPIGPFEDVDFDEWARSIEINFTNQLRALLGALPYRRRQTEHGPCVILFAGGGSNSAPKNYSAYTVSKIALTKMMELIDVETPDVRISIIGPGWVKTKIHQETLQAGLAAGDNLQRTRDRLEKEPFTPIEKVLDCCDWLVQADRRTIGGRNFSVAHDPWGQDDLARVLAEDGDLYEAPPVRQ